MRWLYLVLAALGTFLPYSQFIPWLHEHGLNIRLLFTELFLGRVSAFFGLDAIVSALVLFVFIFHEVFGAICLPPSRLACFLSS